MTPILAISAASRGKYAPLPRLTVRGSCGCLWTAGLGSELKRLQRFAPMSPVHLLGSGRQIIYQSLGKD